MPDQPSPSEGLSEFDRLERRVLFLLLESDDKGPWSVAEICRAIGEETLALDALFGLQAAGLVHRVHELVFPSRAAVHVNRLVSSF
jgi:hypothetical protein